jgi:outer membrane protein assembly factor BamB
MAGDWPQILGPDRNGIARGEALADRWPEQGPKVPWERPVGEGLAGPAVVGDRLVLWHRIGDSERAEALDAHTGKSIWRTDFPTDYRGGIAPDNGSRCVPLIHEEHVYLHGATGDVHCVAWATGKVVWSTPARKDFQSPEGYFGAGSTPIVEDGKLILNVGGRDESGLVAFDLQTGKTLWTAFDDRASYSSPTAATIAGLRHLIFVTRLNCVSVDPANGKMRFQFPFGKRGATVNAATPLVFDDHLFLTASYGIGAVYAKLSANKAEMIWQSDDVMSSQFSTPIYKNGFLYGVDGREDLGIARFRCVDARTGNVIWTREGFGMAALISAGDKLLILKTSGELVLAKVSPDGFDPLATVQAFKTKSMALPALANGRLFARDTQTLKCFQVGNSPP